MRVRVMEALYIVELRHHEDPADSSDKEEKERVIGKKFHVTRDWLCAWLGSEHLCVNVSRRLGDWGTGEIHTELSHSFHLLNATGNYYFIRIFYTLYPLHVSQPLYPLDAGVPASSSGKVRWAQDGSKLSVLAEVEAGPEHLKAELNGGKTGQVIPRWEYFSRLQHQVKALLKQGVSSSIQAKTHFQVQEYHLCFQLQQANICAICLS